jgi:hypothetical protein
MYFDKILKQAEEPIKQQKVFSDKDEEMFVSIFKADDDDTGESLENPDEGGGNAGEDAGAAQGGNENDTGESLENPGEGNQQGEDDNGTGESLENPDDNQDTGGQPQGGEDNGSGENLENPDQSGQDPNVAQDPNAQQPPQDPNQDAGSDADKKIQDINERINLFRKHRKLEDTVQVLYDAVSGAIGQVVTTDSRIKLLRIQKDLLVTKGQLEYAISLDFKTIDMEKATEIYKVLEKKVSLMTETIRKIRKENAEA